MRKKRYFHLVKDIIAETIETNRDQGRFTRSNFDPINIENFVYVMEFVGAHTIQFLHPVISWRARETLTILVLRISCLLHLS